MPPKIRFTRDAVVEAALKIARAKGMTAVNARAIALEMGCSTQPLFRDFISMEALRQEVRVQAYSLYCQRVTAAMENAQKPYKASGLAYLHFALEEPELFKMLFMYDRRGEGPCEAQEDETTERVLEALMNHLGLTREKARLFHLYSWISVHGMASMIATHYLAFTETEMDELMSGIFQATRLLFEEKEAMESS